MPAKLSVNLNAIAMLRNRRDLPWPSVTGLGRTALQAGASGLTVHPRPDQRHIRFSDLQPIRDLIDDEFPAAEFNMEGFPNEAFLELVERHEPEQVTLVPDHPAQATSDHGWDFRKSHNLLGNVVGRLKKRGFRVSLFADGIPDPEALKLAKETGADRIELYTGPYGGCYDDPEKAERIAIELGRTAEIAIGLGLAVNAGHDLTVANLPLLVEHIPELAEVSIGHGLTADALEYGMAETVRRFRRACGETA
ncbi:pyridoxine 5'-phosphate synthase [Sinorhizobium meliloti]|uniref:pyridoxine 5'-phosphate synthase n=1 Tax=Rhizobium meliloti TaxID=382 RepID=UPI00030DD8CC|nr:pyridoxine 5'-phosphate synthase [Sinorhizobium meliloti]MDE3874698.1 pyridoxine 5'-phosphate synthase [Sinorhizobium meliloti]MQX61523.1 pyridoxine 5'-phosphate synthase [Sinorhizobium meliloti]